LIHHPTFILYTHTHTHTHTHSQVRTLYKEDLIPELLKEDSEVANKRKAAEELVEVMQQSLNILNEVRDFK
jgi:hypothetical protein